jgi:hypothetical protein
MTRVSDKQKIGTLHSDGLGSRRRIRQWTSKTPSYMFYPQACVRLRDCRKLLNACPEE